MSFAVARATPRHVAMTGLLPSELRALAGDVVRLAMADPVAATQRVRELLAALPQAHHGDLAGAVAGALDDATLHRLSMLGAGRDLLVALSSCPHDQIGRLSDALYALGCDASQRTAQQPAQPKPQPHAPPDGASTTAASAGTGIVHAVGNAVGAVGEALIEDARAVGRALADVGKGVLDGAREVGRGIAGAARQVRLGLHEMSVGCVAHLLGREVGAALASVVYGIDRALLVSALRLHAGVLYGMQAAANGITDALGPIGRLLRRLDDRVFDIALTLLDTTFGLVRDLLLVVPDAIIGFVGDIERSAKLAAAGCWNDAARQFGITFVNVPKQLAGSVTGLGARALEGAASIVRITIGMESPARRLAAERLHLEPIDGDPGVALDWRVARGDESFESMHDQQRAQAMEEIGIALSDDIRTPQQAAPVDGTADKVKASEGAG